MIGSGTAAYVFVNNNDTWTFQAKLQPNDTPNGFGTSVSTNKDRVAVAGGGAVYVFSRNDIGAWTQEAKLAPGASFAIGLGATVVLQDPILAVSAPVGAGAVYVFVRRNDGWVQQTVLTNGNDIQFGTGLAINGNTVVAGAPDSGLDTLSGAAYVYVNNNGNWTLQARLTPPDALSGPGADFGTSVAIIGNTVLVGAYENPFNDEIGTAHIFVRNSNGWSPIAMLSPSDGAFAQRFANAVTMADETTFICGSPTAVVSGKFNAGAVYSYFLQ